MIKRLHFITHSNDADEQLRQIKVASESGIEWIQLRIKAKSKEEIKELAAKARAITAVHNVKLCINDHLDVAIQCKADACHLGKDDMPIASAKALCEGKLLIGATCNTIEDIYLAYEAGADYFGVGPFRYTSTKEKLSPVLGLNGYKRIINQMQERGIKIPVIAIGGITETDVKELMQTGVHGVAVSGDIIQASDWKERISEYNALLTTNDRLDNVTNS